MNMFLQLFALFLLAGSAAAFSSCSTNSYYSSAAKQCTACPAMATTDANDRFAIDACACQCPANYFMNAGKTECVQCPSGTYSAKGSISPSLATASATQCVCKANFYGSGTKGQQCIACPSGGVLAKQTVTCTANAGNTGDTTASTYSCTVSAATNRGNCKCPKNTYGSFSSDANVAFGCTACALGGFTGTDATSTTGTTCATSGIGCTAYTDCKCPAGTYRQARVVNSDGVVTTVGKCVACPTDRTSAAGSTERSSCVCKTGTYAAAIPNDGAIPTSAACVACPSNAGSPVDANGVSINGSTTQALTCVCNKGYYGDATSGTDSATAKLCNACGTGRSNAAPTAVVNIAASTCVCPINTYATSGANDNGNGCTPCDQSTGKKRTTTAAGQFTVASCKCPVGTYGPDTNVACTACTDGSTTSGIGSTTIDACMCKDNYYGNATKAPDVPAGGTTALCTACDKCGTNGKQTAAATDTVSTTCLCAKNTYGNGTTCTQCPANSTTAGGGTTATPTTQTACNCLANFYGDAQTHTCTACPNGGILDAQTSATATSAINCKCPENTYATDGVSAAGGCTPCAASLVSGFSYSDEGSLSVANCACPANTYRGATACVACPDGSGSVGNVKTAANTASTVAICFCKANYYGESPNGCTLCPGGGTRGAAATATGCDGKKPIEDCKCPKGSWGVNSATATSCTACATGWTTLNFGSTAATQCDRCADNYFGDAKTATTSNPNPTGCTKCPDNSSSTASDASPYVTTDQTVCNCLADFYGNAKSSLTCNACTACPNGGRIAVQTTDTATTAVNCACPPDFYGWNSAITDDSTSSTGAGKCTACPAGSKSTGSTLYQLNTLQSVCNCMANFYGEARASTCTQCPGVDPYPAAGTTAATGSMGVEVPIGTSGSDARTTTTGANVINGVNKFTVATGCTCPVNTWGNGATCTACPANSHTHPDKALGTGTAPTTRDVCMCNTNYYGDARTGSCSACPGTTTIIAQTCAATTIDMCLCPKDTYGDKPATNVARTCTPCGTNSYAAAGSKDITSCTCPAGKYGANLTAATGAGCTACASGTPTNGRTSAVGGTFVGTTANGGTGGANGAATNTAESKCTCPVNTFSAVTPNTAAGACTACTSPRTAPAGSMAATACACPANKFSAVNPNTADGACTGCHASRSSPAGSLAASACRCINVNMWGGTDNSACQACPTGSSMKPDPCRTVGPDSQALCYCDANYYGNGKTTTNPCATCPIQTSPNIPENTKGVLAAQTDSTNLTTNILATACECPANTYGTNGGTATSCKACPSTSTYTSTSVVGSTECSCPAGFYWVAATTSGSTTTPASCKACPSNSSSAAGTTASIGQKACYCLAGFYGNAKSGADTTAAKLCKACATGRTSTQQTVNTTTKEAVPTDADAACLCPAKTYAKSGANDNNASDDKKGCVDCTANSTSVMGSTAITACRCDANFYGNAAITGGTCTACVTGRSSVAQSTGTTVIATLISSCVCPAGKYATNNLNNNVGGCTACPTGKTTTNNMNNNDSNSGNLKIGDCSTCAPNYWGNGNTCTQCPSSYVTKACTASQVTAGGCGGTSTNPTTVAVCVCPTGFYNIECNGETHNCYGCVGASPTMAPTDPPTFAPGETPTYAPGSPTPVPSASPTYGPGMPTPGPTTGPGPAPGPAPAPTDASSKASSGGSSAGAIVGSICGVLVLGGIGYYFYSQKQALAKQAAENATTGLDSNNKI